MADSTRAILVTDFDGTMTRTDFYRLAVANLLPPGLPDYWNEYRSGRVTHFEALRLIFSQLEGAPADWLALARRMDLDPGAGNAAHRLVAAGWRIVVASAGCRWYIESLLAEAGIRADVHANPGAPGPRGLEMAPPLDSPFFSEETGIDKAAVTRWALGAAPVVAFAGDGWPDLGAARLVEAGRRFAKGDLATALVAEGMAYMPFDTWSQVADILLAAPPLTSPPDGAGERSPR